MKPFLAIDLTTDKKNEIMNGEQFIVAKPDLSLTQSLESSLDNTEKTIKKSQLPLPIRIAHWIFGVVGAIIVVGIIESFFGEESVTLAQAYQNASWLFWLGGACLAIWAFLQIISVSKRKSVFESEESSRTFENYAKVSEAVLTNLKVPPNSKEIDILSFFYKVKNNKIKVCEKGMQIAPYNNLVFNIFTDAENLYLADLEEKYAIPLSAIKRIKSVKKTIRIFEWNKDEECNKGIYKQYKLSEDDYGCIICKGYHILEFEHNNDLWGIYIPSYELPVIEELTGLKAENF